MERAPKGGTVVFFNSLSRNFLDCSEGQKCINKVGVFSDFYKKKF